MKLITAIIQQDSLAKVHEALIAAEITRITVSRCTGHGRQEDIDLYRGQEVEPTLIPKVRLDICCNEAFVDITVNAILKAARHGDEGRIGDGKIWIIDLVDCIRIRTGERGGHAI